MQAANTGCEELSIAEAFARLADFLPPVLQTEHLALPASRGRLLAAPLDPPL